MTWSMRKLMTAGAAATALLTSLVTGTPAAGAQPSPIVATYHVAAGGYALAADATSMWAVNADEFHDGRLYRIDPVANQITLVKKLSFPAGDMTVGFGSIWVSDYFGNAVWRLAPDGHVQAVIRVDLQPQWLDAAFGSFWSSNHHGASMTRIDGATNAVLDTMQVGEPGTFRNGPQAITHDASRVCVESSNLFKLQSVDPTTDAVSTPADASGSVQFCGPIVPIGGFVWSVDKCSYRTYQLGTDGSVQQSFRSTGAPVSGTTLNGKVWIGDDRSFDHHTFVGSDAMLLERDPQTGAVLERVPIGGDASGLTNGFGDLWLFDANSNVIRRIHV